MIRKMASNITSIAQERCGGAPCRRLGRTLPDIQWYRRTMEEPCHYYFNQSFDQVFRSEKEQRKGRKHGMAWGHTYRLGSLRLTTS